jgi:hypothetical protein
VFVETDEQRKERIMAKCTDQLAEIMEDEGNGWSASIRLHYDENGELNVSPAPFVPPEPQGREQNPKP